MKLQWLFVGLLLSQVAAAQSNTSVMPSAARPPDFETMRETGIREAKKEAQLQFRQGNLVILAVGRDVLRPDEEFLEKRYGVRTVLLMRTNRTESLSTNLVDWVEGYNGRMRELLKQRFRTNLFEQAKTGRSSATDGERPLGLPGLTREGR